MDEEQEKEASGRLVSISLFLRWIPQNFERISDHPSFNLSVLEADSTEF
jgi:hypothetical protein